MFMSSVTMAGGPEVVAWEYRRDRTASCAAFSVADGREEAEGCGDGEGRSIGEGGGGCVLSVIHSAAACSIRADGVRLAFPAATAATMPPGGIGGMTLVLDGRADGPR